MKKLLSLTLAALLVFPLTACVTNEEKGPPAEKPVIYLYPEEETEVTVTLDYDGTLTSTYPDYGDGWTVTAQPDGTLTDPETGRTYYCLFWEGIIDRQFDLSTGFCVAGADTAAFLEDALAQLGLTEREANEFIIYWLPRMEGNPYNLISFQAEAYTDSAGLTIAPAPGPRHPDPGVHGVEGAGGAGGSGTSDPHRAGAHRLHRRGVGRRGADGIREQWKSRRVRRLFCGGVLALWGGIWYSEL